MSAAPAAPGAAASPRHMVFVVDDWYSRSGGICTANRMLVELLAKWSARADLRLIVLLPAEVRGKKLEGEMGEPIAKWGSRVEFRFVEYEVESDEEDASKTKRRFSKWLVALCDYRPEKAAPFLPALPLTAHDVVLGHGAITGKGASALAALWGAEYWHMVHTLPNALGLARGEVSDEKRDKELAIIRGKHGSKASRVLGLGPLLEKDWARYLKLPDVKVPMLALNPWLRAERMSTEAHRALGSAGAHLLTVGRMVQYEQKGVLLPAAAMSQFDTFWEAAGRPTYHLRGVAGIVNYDTIIDAAKSEEYKDLFKRSPADIINPGALTDSEDTVRDEVRMADAVLLPSTAEAFGLVALEAMEQGVPVLASSDTGFAEMLRRMPGLPGSEFIVDVVKDDKKATVRAWEKKLHKYVMRLIKPSEPDESSWVERGAELRDAYAAAFTEKAAAEELLAAIGVSVKEAAVEAEEEEASGSARAAARPEKVGVPARRVFEGREAQLDDVLKQLHVGGDVTHTAIVQHTGMTGLGGIGKTATAIEVVYRVIEQRRFMLIVWCNADTLGELDAGLAAAAGAVGVERAANDAATAQRVREQLEVRDEPWLLVLDNADGVNGATLRAVSERVPRTGRGCVLVTSRLADLGKLHARMETVKLDVLDEAEAKSLAAELSGKEARAAADGDKTEAAARSFVAVEQLGGLPLAIEQAAAFVRQGGTFVKWKERFEKEGAKLFKSIGAALDEKHRMVHTTWRTSMELLREADGRFGLQCDIVMRVLAVLAPDAIPLCVVGAACTGDVHADDVVTGLCGHSLVQRDKGTLSVHRLVQAVVRDGMGNEAAVEKVRVRAARLLLRVWPKVWEMQAQLARLEEGRALLPHGLHLVDTCEAEVGEMLNVAECTANTLVAMGSRVEAARVMRRAVDLVKSLDVDDRRVLHSKMVLGDMLRDTEPDESRKVLEETMAAMHRIGDVNVFKCMTLLARPMEVLGEHKRAEELARMALTGLREVKMEKLFELKAMNTLAAVLKVRGKLDEALQMRRDVVKGFTSLHGNGHRDALAAVHNLAGTLLHLGHYTEAERMYRRAVDGSESALGDIHPETNLSRINLARTLIFRGKLDEARGILTDLQGRPSSQLPVSITPQRIQSSIAGTAGTWMPAAAEELIAAIRIPAVAETLTTAAGEGLAAFAAALEALAVEDEAFARAVPPVWYNLVNRHLDRDTAPAPAPQ